MPAWTLAGGLATLRREVDAAHPARSKASDGTLGDAAHAARESDHNPDSGGVVRAWDCTSWVDPATGTDVAETLAEFLRAGKDPRVKYVIWRRRIFSDVDPWTWRPYDGANPHDHHVHISVRPHPTGDDPSPWRYGADMPLTPDDKTWITGAISAAVYGHKVVSTDQHFAGWTVDHALDWMLRTALDTNADGSVELAALAEIKTMVAALAGGPPVDVQLLADRLIAAGIGPAVADTLAARLAQ
jgi:hypothetical protein